MTDIIMGQVRFMLVTTCLGMALMLGYDFWHLLRWILPHHKIVVAVEDILYWSVIAVPVYIVFFIFNEGEIRWYGTAAILFGGILYEKGISRPVRSIGRYYLNEPKRQFVAWLLSRIRKGKSKIRLKKTREKKKKLLQKIVK